jgi:hypothetical protein
LCSGRQAGAGDAAVAPSRVNRINDDHDQRFRELIRLFFPDFLRLFFADWAVRFDLSAVEWVEQELLPDPPAGERHLLDLVAKVRAVVGEDGAPVPTADGWAVLVHIEIESPDRTTLLKPRLPRYYSHLRDRHGLKVLPLVLCLKVGLDGIGVDEVEERLFDFVPSTFRYLYVGLPALNAEEYVAGDNWLGVALSALMRMPRERVMELGAEALARITDAPALTTRQRHLLGECVEAYIEVPEANLKQFHDMIQAKATGRVQPVNKTSYDRGKEAGLEQGRRIATLELLEAQLQTKFGALSADTLTALRAMTDDQLKRLGVTLPTAASLAELGL